MKGDPLKPSVGLLSKLGSIIVHYDEFCAPGGLPVDKDQADALLQDPEVVEWMKDMGALLPAKRSKP